MVSQLFDIQPPFLYVHDITVLNKPGRTAYAIAMRFDMLAGARID